MTNVYAVPKNTARHHIVVVGRRWFDKQGGNTYHSVTVFVNGSQVGRVPFAYGYDSHYLQTALGILKEARFARPGGQPGKGKAPFAAAHLPLSLWARNAGCTLVDICIDVPRKADL